MSQEVNKCMGYSPNIFQVVLSPFLRNIGSLQASEHRVFHGTELRTRYYLDVPGPGSAGINGERINGIFHLLGGSSQDLDTWLICPW